MDISVVVPTCNRKDRLVSLLNNLDNSSLPVVEVIIVDSGEDLLSGSELAAYKHLAIRYLRSEKSVCIQRNTGIRAAITPWIFLCDDDVEVPVDYLQKIAGHIQKHPSAGAVSGLFLQKENDVWKGGYSVTSSRGLIWHFIFGLSMWGKITCPDNFFTRPIKRHYTKKGNHLSKAGWPVITNMSGEYTSVPVYTLGAAIVKREWLLQSPYDEVLDRHGIGDNYGVAIGFPPEGIHIVPAAFVYHHHEPANRLKKPLQYYRRVLALEYFISTKPVPPHIKKRWFLWSLTGSLLAFIIVRNGIMIKPAFKAIRTIVFGRNPYTRAAKNNERVVEPLL